MFNYGSRQHKRTLREAGGFFSHSQDQLEQGVPLSRNQIEPANREQKTSQPPGQSEQPKYQVQYESIAQMVLQELRTILAQNAKVSSQDRLDRVMWWYSRLGDEANRFS